MTAPDPSEGRLIADYVRHFGEMVAAADALKNPVLPTDYAVTSMGAGHRWLARAVPGARHQIAVIGLTEAEARSRFEDAWRRWCELIPATSNPYWDARDCCSLDHCNCPVEFHMHPGSYHWHEEWPDHDHHDLGADHRHDSTVPHHSHKDSLAGQDLDDGRVREPGGLSDGAER